MSDNYLGDVPLFAGMPVSELELLRQHSRRRIYAPKTQLIWRGEPGDTLHVIQSGSVRVHRVTENGTEVTLNILGPGSWFGELSLIDRAPRSADITTIDRTECLVLDGESLRIMIERNPAIALHMLRHLAGLVRQMNDSLEVFASLNVPGRIAHLLLQLAQNHGSPWATQTTSGKLTKGTVLSVNLTRTDIKSFVGATREHVTKIMSDFTRSGCIMTDPQTGNIVILNIDKLSRQFK